MTVLDTARVETPVGTLAIAVRDEMLCALGFEEHWEHLVSDLRKRFGDVTLRDAVDPAGIVGRIETYMAGDIHALDGITVDPGGTPFQSKVWRALREVKAGETTSYSRLAARIGNPRATRAVGAANGDNPIAIVIPCHRVIRSDGSLCGYGGGVDRKRWLLAHEGVIPATLPR